MSGILSWAEDVLIQLPILSQSPARCCSKPRPGCSLSFVW